VRRSCPGAVGVPFLCACDPTQRTHNPMMPNNTHTLTHVQFNQIKVYTIYALWLVSPEPLVVQSVCLSVLCVGTYLVGLLLLFAVHTLTADTD
jgi:hypothetical protein